MKCGYSLTGEWYAEMPEQMTEHFFKVASERQLDKDFLK